MWAMVRNDLQAVQRHAGVERHDSIPAVAGPAGFVAESDAAEIAFRQNWKRCR